MMSKSRSFLDALLLLHRKVARAQVDQEEETADDGCAVVNRVSNFAFLRVRKKKKRLAEGLEKVVSVKAATETESDSSDSHRGIDRKRRGGTHLRKSRCGCEACTRHQALTVMLNMVKTTTRKSALWRAL